MKKFFRTGADAEKAAALDAAKQKRIEEREAAKLAHAAFLAKHAIAKPQKDLALEEWEAKEAVRRRELARATKRKRRAALTANRRRAKAASLVCLARARS
jgi:hypothetical protein